MYYRLWLGSGIRPPRTIPLGPVIMTLAMVLLMPSYFVVITVSNMLEDVRHRSIESVDQRIDEIRNSSRSDYTHLYV